MIMFLYIICLFEPNFLSTYNKKS